MAGSIKILQFVQQYHRIIGVYPPQSNQKYLSTTLTRMIFSFSATQFLFSTAAFFAFKAKSMFDYGSSFSLLISIMYAIAAYVIFILQSENTMDFIANCEGFIEKRVHSKAAYGEVIAKIELFNKLLFFTMSMSVASCLLTTAPFTYVRYFIFDMGENSYYLFWPCCYPFNWKTPFGYLVAWMGECIGIISVTCIIIQFLNLVIATCGLFIFIADDITQDVTEFNFGVTTTSNENRAESTIRFCEIVKIYLDAKQCIKECNEIIEYSLFAFFLWTLLGLAGVLVALQFLLWDDESSLLEITLLIFGLIWSMMYICLVCEPGTRMTNQFEYVFSSEVSQCDWYALTVKQQRTYMIFLSDTQQPVKLTSYANITCNRETFKKITNGSFSYFMSFRNFRQ